MIAGRTGMTLTFKEGRTIKRLGGVYSQPHSYKLFPVVRLLIMPDLIFTSKRSAGTGCVGRNIDLSMKKPAVDSEPILMCSVFLC